jgi:hypothetical protein
MKDRMKEKPWGSSVVIDSNVSIPFSQESSAKAFEKTAPKKRKRVTSTSKQESKSKEQRAKNRGGNSEGGCKR